MQKLTLLFTLALVFAIPSACAQEMDHSAGGDHDGDHSAMHENMPPMRANDAPRASSNAGVMQTIGTTTVMIHYGRPSVKGRTIFSSESGALAPYGQVWRTGANEAPVVAFSGPVTIGGETLDAGTYSLFTIPGEAEWTLIFNRVAEQWGAFNYDESMDALRTMATPEAATSPQEQFQISFEGVSNESAVMVLAWDDVRVPVTITVAE